MKMCKAEIRAHRGMNNNNNAISVTEHKGDVFFDDAYLSFGDIKTR